MSSEEKDILAALQDFKTNFELAKAATAFPFSATSSPKDKGTVSPSIRRPREPPKLEVPKLLTNYLKDISKTGTASHPWKMIKPLFLCKLDEVIRWYNNKQPFDKLPPLPNSGDQTFKEVYTAIVRSVDMFKEAPFTVQRLCELICNPEQHYKRIDKFLHALEKNTTVVTTVDEMGRKLSTAAEVDLTVTDPQQTSRLLALFDWINCSSDDDASANGMSSNTESPSALNESQAGSNGDRIVDKAMPLASHQSGNNLQDQQCTATVSTTSTASEPLAQLKPSELEVRPVKRPLCEENSEDCGDNPNKRARIESEAGESSTLSDVASITPARVDSDSSDDRPESITDTSELGENDKSISEDDSGKTSEGIDDDLNELPPIESMDLPVELTVPVDTELAVKELSPSPELSVSTDTKAAQAALTEEPASESDVTAADSAVTTAADIAPSEGTETETASSAAPDSSAEESRFVTAEVHTGNSAESLKPAETESGSKMEAESETEPDQKEPDRTEPNRT